MSSTDPSGATLSPSSSSSEQPGSPHRTSLQLETIDISSSDEDEIPSRSLDDDHLDSDTVSPTETTSEETSSQQLPESSQTEFGSANPSTVAIQPTSSTRSTSSRGLLTALWENPRSRASRVRRSRMAYAASIPPVAAPLTSIAGQLPDLLTIPCEIRNMIIEFVIPQASDVHFCPCLHDGVTDCATVRTATASQLFDQMPNSSLHQVNRQLRAETLQLVQSRRMKNIHVCSPVCLDAVLRLCDFEQLMRTQKVYVHIDNAYITPPSAALGWFHNYNSIYKIHSAAVEVAGIFVRVERSTTFYDLLPEMMQSHHNNTASPVSILEIELDQESIYDSPAPFSSLRCASSAHTTCYRDGRVRADPSIS